MNLRKTTSVILTALVIASCSGCGSDAKDVSSGGQIRLLDASEMFSSRDVESGYDESECTVITLEGNSASVRGSGASVRGSTVTISAEGDYLLSGSLDDGAVIVDADKKDKVRLLLKGVSINSASCAAIEVRQADKVFITLVKKSENTLSNVSSATVTDDVDAVIFSKDDLTLNGEGKLTIAANTGHGIVCKDDLVITGGSYDITSEKKALDANDSIRVADGSFTIDSGADALHCENDNASKGYIYIADGTFSITAGTDGLDASGVIQIDNGSLTLKTGGGSANASTKKDGGFNGGWGRWGGRAQGGNAPSGASVASDSVSAKGLKSDSSVAVNNGAITIDSSDDAIHSDGAVSIAYGSLSIRSGDDGIHAGSTLAISGGNVSISQSYEGLEGMSIAISGGSVSVVSADDGLNAAGGKDQSSVNGRPGQNKFAAQEGVSIDISGGSVSVNAAGDGIDSNGDVTVSGGEIHVSGSANGGNAALDFNGNATVTGGVFIAAGMDDMAQNFGSGSTQGSMLVTVDVMPAGSEITLQNAGGKTLVSYKPEKSYNCVVISTPDVKQGETYTLTAGSASVTVKMDSLIYGSGGMGGGRPAGRRGGRG